MKKHIWSPGEPVYLLVNHYLLNLPGLIESIFIQRPLDVIYGISGDRIPLGVDVPN